MAIEATNQQYIQPMRASPLTVRLACRLFIKVFWYHDIAVKGQKACLKRSVLLF